MKNNFFFITAFLVTGFIYGQDSSSKNAIGKQSDIINETNIKVSSGANQTGKDVQSVKTPEATNQQTNGDLNEKKRNSVSDKNTKEEPK